MNTTKVNDFASKLMNHAISSLKEEKTKKAEAAFYSVLDTAISGNTAINSGRSEAYRNVSRDAGKDYDAEITDTDTGVREFGPQQTKNTADKGSVGQENVDKAEDMIEDVCGELGITKEELFAQYDQLLDAIASILMQKFDITSQDLNQVLQDMGVSLMDMLEPANLMDTLVVLAGAEDISAVLTDENLYQQIQEVTAELQELQKTFVSDKGLDAGQLQELQESISKVMNAAEEEVSQDVPELRSLINTGNEEAAAVTEEPVLEIITDKAENAYTAGRDNDSRKQQMTGGEGFQHFAGRVAEYADNRMVHAGMGTEFAQQADMESIIRQVTDYVKLQVHAETTSLEMQLHPESYGKLNLQVSVREGVVTAKMAVENEQVKAALEAQVVQLREDMNERGLRVDAVEVTIASHEFERNLEEGQENQQSAQEGQPGTRRNINLQENGMSLEELAAMSEAEALTRRIMLENGNSIDFSA